MKKIILSLFLSFAALLLYSQQASENSLLWRINSKDSKAPSYLFGTVHLPQKRFLMFSDSVYAAIQNTNIFYNEIDFLNGNLMFDTSMLGFYQEKLKHIDSIQKTDNWKRLIDKLNKKYNAHLSYDSTEQFINFSQQFMAEFYEPEEGISIPDIMLAKHAITLGKKTGGLETFKLQMNMLYDIIDARLLDTALNFENEAELMSTMKRYYLNERVDSISRSVAEMNTSYRQIVFDRRNVTMADSIEKNAMANACFFAIGVGHVGGHGGVVERLRQKGFIVTPIHSDNKMSLVLINSMLDMHKPESKKKSESFRFDEGVKEEGVKIEVMDAGAAPPPPPPRSTPKKTTVKPAVKKKPKN
jgi:uncharacterized protein YbaP (TraB family)